jgi:ADP-ribose pyrophosphatase YjhB (NUDIX family)
MSGFASPRAERSFCRLSTGRSVADGYWGIPPDGLCLSSFVLISPKPHPDRVLVGRINPKADWMRIGALDPKRVQQNTSGWMLPSSQLMYFESPEAAAQRVVREQLGFTSIALGPPHIVSEVYRSIRHPEREHHWDLEFLFRGYLESDGPVRHPAWQELKFLDPKSTPRGAFARSHEDVLENAGFGIGP